jgi:triphosphoribosyl-dephospho-CoA synthase
MSSAASTNDVRAGLLEAREARQRELQRALSFQASTFLLISTNVPGGDKHRPGLSRLLRGALDALQDRIGIEVLHASRDLLGPYLIAASKVSPQEAKGASLAIEHGHPSARLLDVDVYHPDGSQFDRAALGLPPRACLLCPEPARECILLKRHPEKELLARVDSLLEPYSALSEGLSPRLLARNLPGGALRELDLTPKPGLVDRHDAGSHPDLSYAAMGISIGLLPLYFEDILRCFSAKRALEDYVRVGIAAEDRMNRAIHANAHKGFIFLSGLVLMAACECEGRLPLLRQRISDLATRFFTHFESTESRGAELRNRYGLGGIRVEAERGLPAVFEQGWPSYREALEAGWEPTHASFYLMAILMQEVEDTTAIRRCGTEGLARLRRDGAHLQRLLERRQDPVPWLTLANEEYRQAGLTMGGVADCMALTFALQATAS